MAEPKPRWFVRTTDVDGYVERTGWYERPTRKDVCASVGRPIVSATISGPNGSVRKIDLCAQPRRRRR